MNEATKDLNSFTNEQRSNLEAFFYVMDKMKVSPVVATLKDYIEYEKTNNTNSINNANSL